MNDARIRMTRALAGSFDALCCLHTFFAEVFRLGHNPEQFINTCEGTRCGLI
jgi:hypothetical protein